MNPLTGGGIGDQSPSTPHGMTFRGQRSSFHFANFSPATGSVFLL